MEALGGWVGGGWGVGVGGGLKCSLGVNRAQGCNSKDLRAYPAPQLSALATSHLNLLLEIRDWKERTEG